MRPTASQFLHTLLFSPGTVAPLVADPPFFFKAFIFSDKRLIPCFCLAAVLTDISRLADNSSRGTPFAAVCVAAAAILSKYTSRESSIRFLSWGVPSVFLWSFLLSQLLVFSGAAPNRADPQKGFILLPLQLPLVALQCTPSVKSFSIPTRFACLPGVSTTPVSPFRTHWVEAEMLAPQRAYTCHG